MVCTPNTLRKPYNKVNYMKHANYTTDAIRKAVWQSGGPC